MGPYFFYGKSYLLWVQFQSKDHLSQCRDSHCKNKIIVSCEKNLHQISHVISFTLIIVIKFSQLCRLHLCINMQQASWQGCITAKIFIHQIWIASEGSSVKCPRFRMKISYEWYCDKVSLLWLSSANKIAILPKWKFMLYWCPGL